MDHQILDEDGDEAAWDLADEDARKVDTTFLDLHREWTSRQAHFHTVSQGALAVTRSFGHFPTFNGQNPPSHITTMQEGKRRERATRENEFLAFIFEEGKKSSVQQGFEAGYTQGVKAGLNCGLARGWAGAFTALPHAIQNLLLVDTARMQVDESQTALSSISSEKAVYLFYHHISRIDDLKDKADISTNDTVVEDLVKEKDIATSTSRLDSSVNVEKLHLELQSIMKSSGIIQ